VKQGQAMSKELHDEIVIDFEEGAAKIPRFNEVKATQLAGKLLQLRGTRQMHYLKLIKLMYLIDREALVRWGWSMTGDRYVSMEHGQVLSGTYDLIRDEHFGDSYWKRYISPPLGEYEVRLVAEPEASELSEAELTLIEEVYNKFGRLNRWRLRDYTHRLPEYRQTNGPSLDVDYASVLKGAQKSDEEIRDILEDLEEIAALEDLAI
jgi:hypothetical protein